MASAVLSNEQCSDAAAALPDLAVQEQIQLQSEHCVESQESDESECAADSRAVRLRAAAASRMDGLRVVLEDLSDYGNRAAIFRSVEALGLLHVHEIVQSRHASHTAKGRSIVNGAEKWLEVHNHATPEDCVRQLHGLGFVVLAAMPPGGAVVRQPMPLEQLDFSVATALVFGNEARGVSATLLNACDGCFTVPLPGLSESLNVSVAAAICCHFGRHQRAQALGLSPGCGDLASEEITQLVATYEQRGRQHGFTASVRCSRSHRTLAATLDRSSAA